MAGSELHLELYENLRRDLRESERILRTEFTEADRDLRREFTEAIDRSNEMHAGRFDKIDETLDFQNELLVTRAQLWPNWRRDTLGLFIASLFAACLAHFVFHLL